MVNLRNRDLVSIDDFTQEEWIYLMELSQKMFVDEKAGKRYSSVLENKKLGRMFYQDSTRTRMSHETAMKELGGLVAGFSSAEGTSIKKKENIFNTVKMMEANHADVIVMRNPLDGSVQWAADAADIPVINGADGIHEHPTQAGLDVATIYMARKGNLEGLHISAGGDLKNSRTIKSTLMLLSLWPGLTAHLAAPEELAMPAYFIEDLRSRGVNVVIHDTLDSALDIAEFHYHMRPQTNLEKKLTDEEMYRVYEPFVITPDVLQGKNVKIMHPMPIDSHNQEIVFDVTFMHNQLWLQQAENGVFFRKALLHALLADTEYQLFQPQYTSEKTPQSNNYISLPIHTSPRKNGEYLHAVQNGLVIDHLPKGKLRDIQDALRLGGSEPVIVTADNLVPKQGGSKKAVLKLYDIGLTSRIAKEIALHAPDATINVIQGGVVAHKYKVVMCNNDNCITQVVTEDVPSRFYQQENGIRCHYCHHPTILPESVHSEQAEIYKKELPRRNVAFK